MRSVTSWEFNLWSAKFDTEWEDFNPLHWYLAQIAYEVRRTAVKPGWTGRIAQFILDFAKPAAAKPLTLEEAAAASKAAWRARLGQNDDGGR